MKRKSPSLPKQKKEIGIRKVFGVSATNIVNLLSKEFLILIGIAILIAFPVAYYLLESILQGYAHLYWFHIKST